MRLWFGLLILMVSSRTFGQECTRYMVVDVFARKPHLSINGLSAADFTARLDGHIMPVDSARQNFNNRILVLVETSGPGDSAEAAKLVRAVVEESRYAPSGRQIAFGAYSKKSAFTRGFVTDSQQRARAIDEVMGGDFSADDRFALYDALHEALLMFGEHQSGDTIVLVSDGFDNNSKRSGDDLEKELIATGVRLNVIIRNATNDLARRLLARFEGRSLKERGGIHYMSSLTGGMYRWGTTDRDVAFAWNGYLVGVQLPKELSRPKVLEFDVRDASGKPSKNAWAVHPFELAPCTAAIATR